MSALLEVPVSAPEPVRTTDSAALALDFADRHILEAVRDIHHAVASRVLLATRLGSVPDRIHSIASNALYAGLSTAMRSSANGLRSLGRRGVGTPLEASISGRQLLSTINAMVGAELAAGGDPGAIRMGLRVGASDVPVEGAALAAAYPRATDRIVLCLHGLGENDESWQLCEEEGGVYPSHVASRTDWTPLVLRYNTGLSVSENGAALADLVSRLTSCWPVPITSIAFVGHSMGALLVRSTTVHALAGEHEWVRRVALVVCLGTPHLGAQLEKAVTLGSQALTLVPESPFGASRSAVLRHESVTRDRWEGGDLTAKWGRDRIGVAPLTDAAYHFVAAALPQPSRPLVDRVGDLLRSVVSATHGADNGQLPGDSVEAPADTADHAALLTSPQIADWLVTWLQPTPGGGAYRRTEQEAVSPTAAG